MTDQYLNPSERIGFAELLLRGVGWVRRARKLVSPQLAAGKAGIKIK